MLLSALPLTALEITTLEAACAQGPHPRMRRRAQAVLGHHRGASIGTLATLFAVQYNTVSQWLRNWRSHGLAGLAEARRSGRPSKLPPAIKKKLLPGWVRRPNNCATGCPTSVGPGGSSCTSAPCGD